MVKPNQSAASEFVEDRTAAQKAKILSVFDEDDEPQRVIVTDTFEHVIVNPVTVSLVDLSDDSPEGIDKAIECMIDIDAVMDRLASLKRLVKRKLCKLSDKNSESKTRYVRGNNYEVKLTYPSRQFNNSGLKKLYEEYSEDGLIELRDTFLRITDVAVNLKPFKHAEATDEAPAKIIAIRNKIAKLEEIPYSDPSVSVTMGEVVPLGNDPIVIRNLNEEEV